jgi:GTPase SAR1 family protein
VKILVGNKCDLENERRVSQQAAQELAKQNDMHYYDTSAKNDYNIDAFMDDLIG